MIDEAQVTRAELEISKTIAECLEKHYPGHAWGVRAQLEQGVVHVLNLNLSGQLGYLLHMDNLMKDPGMKSVIRAGGEILERYNLARGRMEQDKMDADLVYDFKGDVVRAD